MSLCRLSACGIALAGLLAIAGTVRSEPEKIDLCATCHGEDGEGVGYAYVPVIASTPAAHLEEALHAYQNGTRRCVGVPVMCDTVEFLSEEDIAELAEHYSAMPRISLGEQYDEKLAQIGEMIHEEHCAKCHVLPNDENVEDALGIPLHGQRSAYLRLALGAYMTGDRKTLIPEKAKQLALLGPENIDALVNYYVSYQP